MKKANKLLEIENEGVEMAVHSGFESRWNIGSIKNHFVLIRHDVMHISQCHGNSGEAHNIECNNYIYSVRVIKLIIHTYKKDLVYLECT